MEQSNRMKNKLSLKKLLILGGNPETGVLVQIANKLGIITIVVDPNPFAPAKRFSKKHYNIDGFDIPNLIIVAKNENIDGVLVGVADILVPPYLQLCEAMGLPCYATNDIIDALSSKDSFTKVCNKFGIEGIPTFNLDENFKVADLNEIIYPVLVKPVDNGGGVGMSVCFNKDELIKGGRNAIKHSRKKIFLTEKYMNCDDMVAYYTFMDGEIFLSAVADRITTKKQRKMSPVCIASVYPSKHTDDFYNSIHPVMSKMFKEIGIKNGVLAVQFFVEGNKFYAYDPGFRLQGEAMHIYINEINKFDHRLMLINYALTGSMGVDDLKDRNDFLFRGMHACTFWILLKDGIIQKISGLNELQNDPSIIFIMQRFYEGDVVLDEMLGNEKQVLARVYIVSESKNDLVSKINEIKSKLFVFDEDGKNMIVDLLDTSFLCN
jgi:biotin carboxylase